MSRRPAIDPGAFRHRLTLEEPSDVSDGQGGATRSWAYVDALWCRMEPLTARQDEQASQTRETLTHRVTLRSRDGVVAGMRLTKGERAFEIMTIHDPDESGRYLELACREVTP